MSLIQHDAQKLALCPTYPEESWRKTNPEIFFLPENEVINFQGNSVVENLNKQFIPWKVSYRNSALLSEKINSLENSLGQSAVKNIQAELPRIVLIEVLHGYIEVFVSEQLKTTLELSSKPFEVTSISPNSEIGFALASRLKACSPHEFVIHIENKNLNEVPLIIIKNYLSPNFAQSYSALKLEIAKNSKADYILLDAGSNFSYHRHSVTVGENGSLNQLWFQCFSSEVDKSVSLYERHVKLEANAQFKDAQLHFPVGNTRVTSNIEFVGERGQAHSGGVVVAAKGKFDYEPIQHHRQSSGQSSLNLKMILAGRARCVFQGLVKIDVKASKTKAIQANKNLLLSKQARVDASPRLEILPNDVVCKHGSATGELDQKQLYYMATRGFSPEAAKGLIVHSFAREGLCNLQEGTALLNIAESALENLLGKVFERV